MPHGIDDCFGGIPESIPADFAVESRLNADVTSVNTAVHFEGAGKLPPKRSTSFPA